VLSKLIGMASQNESSTQTINVYRWRHNRFVACHDLHFLLLHCTSRRNCFRKKKNIEIRREIYYIIIIFVLHSTLFVKSNNCILTVKLIILIKNKTSLYPSKNELLRISPYRSSVRSSSSLQSSPHKIFNLELCLTIFLFSSH
jgi:hypothetical protein